MKQPLAYVHREAKVADNVVIEPFVTIDKDVEIGEGVFFIFTGDKGQNIGMIHP